MQSTGLFDLHCDTLTADTGRLPGCTDTLDAPGHAAALGQLPRSIRRVQLFALFLPDHLRGMEAVEYFACHCANYYRQMQVFSRRVCPCRTFGEVRQALAEEKCAALLTVENGSVLAGELRRVQTLWEAGVRVLTLVWNGENELGSGQNTTHGLTPFGREAVAALEERGILIDASHLNDRGMEQLLSIARKPLLATHSNARTITDCKRNLPDDFIRELVAREGLIGLNFHAPFLGVAPCEAGRDALLCHVEHFLKLGAGKHLALGADFDGADPPVDLCDLRRTLALGDFFVERGLPPVVVNDILFGNAYRFFQKNLC